MLPNEKPKLELSEALERNYDNYLAPRPEDNELFTQFKYSKLKGFEYNNHNGTISRRDPSKVIFSEGKYYVWYTYRNTITSPKGASRSTETIPSTDWDLAEIWYATSEDGFTWKEQGVAVSRPKKPNLGWRSISTPDILFWEGKYYLYYQGFSQVSGARGDDCIVTASVADTPDGPWRPSNKTIIPNGPQGAWDQFSVHDPYLLVRNGKIHLYYKSDFDGDPTLVRMQGLATADSPFGPFSKHPLNPVINSGHETSLFPFKSGVAALVFKDGNEHNTIQYAEDGVNFKIAAISELMPYAAAPFVPDAFTDTKNGRGITWGLAHFNNVSGWDKSNSMLIRFDCDLSQDVHDPIMKKSRVHYTLDVYFQQGLTDSQRERIKKDNQEVIEKDFEMNHLK